MQPLTYARAKPSLPVLGVPLIVHAAHLLRSAGIREIVVNLHRHPRTIRTALEGGQANPLSAGLGDVTFTFSHEKTLLGTGGGIGRVREWLAEEGTAIIVNSDFLSDIDLEAALDHHRRGGAAGTLIGVDPKSPFRGEIWTDGQRRIVSIGAASGSGIKKGPRKAGRGPTALRRGSGTGPAKSDEPLVFAGVQLIEPELLRLFPDRRCDSVRDVYPQAIAEGKLAAMRHDGWWWEIGSSDRFLDFQIQLVREGRHTGAGAIVAAAPPEGGSADGSNGPGETAPGTVWLGPGADLPADRVTVRGVVILSAGAGVLPGSELEDVVLLERARVPPSCHLRRCIVGAETVLTGGSSFSNAAIASSPCAPPSGLANAPETPWGRPAPPEGCRVAGDLWVRDLPPPSSTSVHPPRKTAPA
jgi:NDP-sugar pyrophosphorylase family protein